MRQIHWNKELIIESEKDIQQLIRDFNQCKPHYSGFDTETTGLHIKLDRAFMIQFGFCNLDTKQGYIYDIDLREDLKIKQKAVQVCWYMAEHTQYAFGHNVKFDLHMVNNINLPYKGNNVVDTQVLIRLCSDAVPEKRGGDSLKLKNYAFAHIERSAKFNEAELKKERSEIAKGFKKGLKIALKEKGYTWKSVERLLNDSLTDIEELEDTQLKDIYKTWYASLPLDITMKTRSPIVESKDIPFYMNSKEVLYKYGSIDVIYTIEIGVALIPIMRIKKQQKTFERENAVLRPLWEMEQEGFYMNKSYIKESHVILRQYILKRRNDFVTQAGQSITSGQSDEIVKILKNKFNSSVKSTGKDVLEEVVSELHRTGENKELLEFIETLQELRTLEKWYSTYLMRFVKEMEHTDYIYTQLNQAGPVTGRLSSDFQQFPKGEIKDKEGNVLFKPRNMIKTPPYAKGMLFLDYSQIELRVQALYTILVDHPDTNLCRAYMPFNCINNKTNEIFNYRDPEVLKQWNSGEWHYKENPEKEWEPTDVHGATAKEAFPETVEGTPEFKEARYKAKTINFAKNYGASRKVTAKQFKEYSEEDIDRIDGAYYKAFPGVKAYHSYCYSIVKQGFGTNLFSRRFYNISGHNFMNAAIQGSSADFLKERITALNKYMKENNCKSKMIMNIHDEIVWALVEGEEHYLPKFQEIMQEFDGSLVPIVADAEYTTGLWGEKEDVYSEEDIININSETNSV